MASIENIDQHKILFPVAPKVLQEKQIQPLYHGHVMHSLKVSKQKTDKNQL